MEIHWSYYSVPLWFGFIQAWIYAVLLWYRSYQNNRKSDLLLGLILVGMAFNIWEYMLGFSGIDFLWTKMNFFPRTLGFAFAPICYFYFKSQVNQDFKFTKKDFLYFLPFVLHTVYHVGVFSIGQDFVKTVEKNFHWPFHIPEIETYGEILLNSYVIFKCLQLYQNYRNWTKNQFSNTEPVSFGWYRNFLIILISMFVIYLLKMWLESYFELNYKEGWWNNLLGVIFIYYVSIAGYAHEQPRKVLTFNEAENQEVVQPKERFSDEELAAWKYKIQTLFDEEKLYLNPELNLTDIATKLKTNISTLSGIINGAFGKNFNDLVNEYRVKEFQKRINLAENKNFTLLGIALECGFNSKSTFNRAVRKVTNQSPKELG
jgi:AraC-like DNA-binding protein